MDMSFSFIFLIFLIICNFFSNFCFFTAPFSSFNNFKYVTKYSNNLRINLEYNKFYSKEYFFEFFIY